MSDLLAVPTASACPQCRATVRAGAPWCTQCYLDLRPAPEPELEPAAVPMAKRADATGIHATGIEATGSEVTANDAQVAQTDADRADPEAATATWPCTTCGATNAITADACAACGAGFLARLRDTEPPLLTLPGVGDVSKLSRAQGVGLAAGIVFAVILLVALLGLF